MLKLRHLAAFALAFACGCGDRESKQPEPFALRQLGTQPLTAEVPDDAGIRDINVRGPDDAGFHGACVTYHPQQPGSQLSGCEGLDIIQDTTQGRRAEDAHVRVASMEEDENGRGTITRAQQLPDGWLLEYMAGQYQAMTVHRTIAGTPWKCELMSQTRAALAEAEKICLSIRPASESYGSQ